MGIITKSVMVRRDLDVPADLARGAGVRVSVSIPSTNDVPAARRPGGQMRIWWTAGR